MLMKNRIVVFLCLTLISLLIAIKLVPEEQVAEEVIPEPVKKVVSAKQIQCLATAIYYEASREPFMGQVAVARVVVNRTIHGFAESPCSVVYQTTTVKDSDGDIVSRLCQFSWVCEGFGIPNQNNARYRRALEIAQQVLEQDKWSDLLPDNVLFFHSTSVNPQWVYKKFTTIGNHVFYAKGRQKIQNDLTTAQK
jgi:spore germination cell wall hydrolase CwlJ-like protein